MNATLFSTSALELIQDYANDPPRFQRFGKVSITKTGIQLYKEMFDL